ncbi:MAG TPA: hypothetical protein VGE12_10930 [Noviherbaspirillum sp.]
MQATKRPIRLGMALLLVCLAGAVHAETERIMEPVSEALHVRAGGRSVLGEADLQHRKFIDDAAAMAEFRKNIITLPRNGQVQLTVEAIDVRGRAVNVTTHPATTYQSLAPFRLSVSRDGRVTAAPSPDSPAGLGGDLAVLIIFDNERQQAWNKVFFNIAQ